jgi:hypothetical protein
LDLGREEEEEMFDRMLTRIMRIIRLDWTVFREIAKDKEAIKEAALIVVIVTFLSAVGRGLATGSLIAFFGDWILAIVISWLGWAVLTYFVGTLVFKGKTDIPEMLRVLGYASAPQLLGLFSFIPCVGWLFPFVGWLLALVAGVLAIREAMDLDTGDAIVTVIISWVLTVGLRAVFWFLF